MLNDIIEKIFSDTQILGILMLSALALLLICTIVSIGAWISVKRQANEIIERIEDTDIRVNQLSKSIKRRVSREYGGERDGDD